MYIVCLIELTSAAWNCAACWYKLLSRQFPVFLVPRHFAKCGCKLRARREIVPIGKQMSRIDSRLMETICIREQSGYRSYVFPSILFASPLALGRPSLSSVSLIASRNRTLSLSPSIPPQLISLFLHFFAFLPFPFFLAHFYFLHFRKNRVCLYIRIRTYILGV